MQPSSLDVTVGLVVRTAATSLYSAVPSLYSQRGFVPAKVVVVDDGATSSVKEALEDLGSRFDLDVLRNARPRGLGYARNQVLDRTQTTYLAWLEPDLVWQPRALELAVERLQGLHDSATLCALSWRRLHGAAAAPPIVHPGPTLDVGELARGSDHCRLGVTVAPTRLYEGVGGFDARLSHLADQDLLLRLAASVQVAGVDDHSPLITQIDGGEALRAGAVVSSMRRFARKHRRHRRLRGRSFNLRQRAETHELASHLHHDAGARIREGTHRLIAQAILLGLRVATSRTPASLTEAGGDDRKRRSQPTSPGKRTDSTTAQPPSGKVEAADGAVLALLAQGDHLAAVERLRDEGVGPQRAWLRGASMLEHAGHTEEARHMLEHALDAHPGEPALRVARLELLARCGIWEDAVEAWRGLGAETAAAVTAETVKLTARSLRALGYYDEAIDVATKGLDRWPDTPPIRKELYKSRGARTDWAWALRRVEPEDPSDRPARVVAPASTVGVVQDLGVLAGGAGPLSGHVSTRRRAPRVSLRVNGMVVASTHAGDVAAPTAPRPFTLNVQQIREYLGDGDRLEIICLDETLWIDGLGPAAFVHTGYPSRVEDLRARLERGAVFTKFGQLRRGNTARRKQRLLDHFERVSAALAQEHDLRCFPFYGNLLGAVRDHDFIPHDVGGFDMGYVSRHRGPREVRAEVLAVARTLLDNGYHLSFAPWAVMVRDAPEDDLFMDINYGWVDPDGRLRLSYGWRHAPASGSAAELNLRSCPMHDRLVAVPDEAEAVLAQIYGATWPVPDQGFDLDAKLERASEYLLTRRDVDVLRQEWPGHVRNEPGLAADDESVAPTPIGRRHGHGTKSSRG